MSGFWHKGRYYCPTERVMVVPYQGRYAKGRTYTDMRPPWLIKQDATKAKGLATKRRRALERELEGERTLEDMERKRKERLRISYSLVCGAPDYNRYMYVNRGHYMLENKQWARGRQILPRWEHRAADDGKWWER